MVQESSKVRIFFLINPRSGGRKTSEIIRGLRQYAKSQNNSITVEELNVNGITEQIARAGTADIIIVGGGDGTFSTLLPSLCGVKSKIGILPLGTGNDLARELGLFDKIPWDDISEIIKFYGEAPSRTITYFLLEHGELLASNIAFVNYVSFGYDAKVVDAFARLRESKLWRPFHGVWGNRLGYAALSLANITNRINTSSSFTIKSNETTHTLSDAKSIIFTNIRSIMGMGKSTVHSSVLDQNIECVIVNNVLNYLAMLSHYKVPLFHPHFVGSSQVWEINDLPPDLHIQIDGEPRPDLTSKNFRIRPGGQISMIVGLDCR